MKLSMIESRGIRLPDQVRTMAKRCAEIIHNAEDYPSFGIKIFNPYTSKKEILHIRPFPPNTPSRWQGGYVPRHGTVYYNMAMKGADILHTVLAHEFTHAIDPRMARGNRYGFDPDVEEDKYYDHAFEFEAYTSEIREFMLTFANKIRSKAATATSTSAKNEILKYGIQTLEASKDYLRGKGQDMGIFRAPRIKRSLNNYMRRERYRRTFMVRMYHNINDAIQVLSDT